MNRRSFYILYAVALVGCAGWSLYRTFTHIDMTRARILVTFWPEWVGIAVLILSLECLRLFVFSRKR